MQDETAEAKKLARRLAALDSMVAHMEPGVLPHFHPFTRLAKRIGLTREQYEAWAKTVKRWDPVVVKGHVNAYDQG